MYLMMILIILGFSIIFISILYTYDNSQANRIVDYYKEQMVSFCEIAEYYNSETYPNMYPCNKWIIKHPLGKWISE